MNKFLLCLLTGATAAAASYAADTPRWLRNPAISPDGSTIAFTYKGDIFTVPASGGNARRITANSAYDTTPVWSPDGKTIVFASDREGNSDLYAVDARGGTPRRLTTFSGAESPLAFTDASTVIFSSSDLTSQKTSRHPTRLTRTYSVDINTPGSRPRLFVTHPMGAASVNKEGDILYHDKKGLEDAYRKHERSSGTSDIWMIKDGKHSKLTTFNGHDLYPVWKGDGSGYYYVSEEDGTLNVYSVSADGVKRQITKFDKHPVRSLTVSDNGTLAFSWDGDLYTISNGGEPTKVDVNINADLYDTDYVKRYVNSGASGMAVSPDGKEVAFVLRGDIYVTDTEYSTTRRITDTPAQERVVEFSPDGRTLVYDSDRDGQWQLFTATISNPAEKRFAYATEIEEKILYKGDKTAQQPSFSPDGKKVAFLEDRCSLRVIDLKTKNVTTALEGDFNYSYADGDIPFQWSPDSRWLITTYLGKGGWNNLDIAAAKADGTKVVDLTESGYSDGNPKWALGGKAVTYETGRYGMKSHGSWGNQSDIMLMALDSEAWDDFNATEEEAKIKEEAQKQKEEKEGTDKKDKKKADKKDKKDIKPLEPDFANRRHRMARLTGNSSLIGDYILSPKGDKLYYVAFSTEGDANLFERDLKNEETKVLARKVSGGLSTDSKTENLFVLTSEGMKKVSLDKGTVDNIDFDADYDRHPSLEREYIYDHMLRQVADKFYDKNLHGVDWEYYGNHYREFLPHISNNNDFAILLSEILGELNASHTGGRYRPASGSMATASLAAFFDNDYKGDGLKVSEVIGGSPLSSKKADVKPGDIITAIDGKAIKAGQDYFPLFAGKAGRNTILTIERASGKKDTVSVKPVTQGELSDLLYKRWVERNEAFVDSISGGRIAYVHVQGMDSPSFSSVYDRLLGKYRNCEAAIVDTRWNGGGWLHNDLAVLLSGKEYVRFTPQGKYIGSEPFSQWSKPSVMLVNEGNYSDAHGSPYTYKTLEIGKLVGAPVPGTMTAVWWETQIDPTLIFGIPQVTNADLNGHALENVQLNPDITVYNNPDDEERGYDAQLEAAVKALLK
ncbi:MAG: S41 family peptidase [Candidatus Amulumruptor caecigallinarius]|nr:S41 family peptidase [Candidatus Amulumruptor caecigallinarius]